MPHSPSPVESTGLRNGLAILQLKGASWRTAVGAQLWAPHGAGTPYTGPGPVGAWGDPKRWFWSLLLHETSPQAGCLCALPHGVGSFLPELSLVLGELNCQGSRDVLSRWV